MFLKKLEKKKPYCPLITLGPAQRNNMCSLQMRCKTLSSEKTHREIRKSLNRTSSQETCSGNSGSITQMGTKKKSKTEDPYHNN
jgi:hypothetical protein